MPEAVLRRRAAGEPDLLPSTLHPVLRRVYAQRGMRSADDLELALERLLPPGSLKGMDDATAVLEAAIAEGRAITIVGDYDADGATGSAVAVEGLQRLGARRPAYLVPSRFHQGYGLSEALVEAARADGAEVLVTVDNGIASVSAVAAARSAGLQVVVTDHHLAGNQLPDAEAIVNPNQPGCDFPSKHLCGVGVVFYVLMGLRARLRAAGRFAEGAEPKLADLLDLVAVGTVADVVRLDANNRILVAEGLRRLRAGRGRPGLAALLALAGREAGTLSAADLGFVVAPRLNAAGRLDDMSLGIECLLAPTTEAAQPLAERLDALNRERRHIESRMRDEALTDVSGIDPGVVGVTLFQPDWHEGVVGLVASRIKERLHRPVVAFARAQDAGMLKGSARSIPGVHIRDVLADVAAAQPGLMGRFGGHAMAAGLSLAQSNLVTFSTAFDAACRRRAGAADLENVIESDGELAPAELALETARALESGGPWGNGFPEPLFDGDFEVEDVRIVGEHHAKYVLRSGDTSLEGIHFGGAEGKVARGRVRLGYRLGVNRWRGRERPELRIEVLSILS